MSGIQAGFGKRLSAYMIDCFCSIPFAVVGWIVGMILAGILYLSHGETSQALDESGWVIQFCAGITTLLYFAFFESSKKQATWGKQVMKLRVEKLNHSRLHFMDAVLRNFVKSIHVAWLYVGNKYAIYGRLSQWDYVLLLASALALMYSLPRICGSGEKQGLHDKFVDSQVIEMDGAK